MNNKRQMRVLFVLPRIVTGGVERVTLNLIMEFQLAGIECALALRRSVGEFLAEANQIVAVHELAKGRLHRFVPALAKLIRAWQPTHVVTAFPDIALLTILSCRIAHSNALVVHGVHNTHGIEIAPSGIWGRLRHVLNNYLAGVVYRHSAAVVTVSEGLRKEVIQRYAIQSDKVHTIYNAVLFDSIQQVSRRVTENTVDAPFRIVSIGRLSRQKGYDVLIDAMAKISKNIPWHLSIYGEGPEHKTLQHLINHHALNEKIVLKGYTADPLECLHSADLFVLPSRHEGLPTVLIESLATGIEVVATDCPHGPKEILMNGTLGRLVPVENVNALSEAIALEIAGHHIADPQSRMDRARAFTCSVSSKRWLELLLTLTTHIQGCLDEAESRRTDR